MEKYFNKFPAITYENYQCKDISRNVRFSDKTNSIPTLFYPWVIESGVRSDVLAYTYYEDPELDWLIYITNGIVDPYYGWYLSETNFDDFIRKKYGSLEDALQRVKYYRLNWIDDDSDISVSFYDNTLTETLKKYYSPNYGQNSKIISYRKKKEFWYSNTNKILRFDVTYNGANQFANSELVTIYQAELPVGNCEVITSNSTTVTVKNISGNTSANNVLTSLTASANVIDTDIVVDNITDEEFVYWGAVTCYEYEREKNEEKKFIRLIDAGQTMSITDQFRKKIQE